LAGKLVQLFLNPDVCETISIDFTPIRFHKVCAISLHVHLHFLLRGEPELCVSEPDSYRVVSVSDRCIDKSTGPPAFHKIVQTNKSYDVS
jgi:hypothetical protein